MLVIIVLALLWTTVVFFHKSFYFGRTATIRYSRSIYTMIEIKYHSDILECPVCTICWVTIIAVATIVAYLAVVKGEE